MILEIYRFTTAEESGDSFAWLVREAVCDTFSSLIWDVRYYECGQFEVYIAATPENMQIFQKGYVIGRSDDTKNYGIIEKIRLETDTENGDYITVSGRFLTSLLSRRIIYPALNFTTETSYEDIVKTAVEKNCIKSGVIPNIKRVIPSLTIGSVFGDCWQRKTKLQVSYENLLEFVYGICQTIGGTINVSLVQYRADIFDGRFKMRLDLSEGIDKSVQQSEQPITIFSDTYDNLSSYAYENDDKTKSNFAFTFGQGEGTARSRVTCYTGDTEPKELERYEIYVDARDLSQEETDDEGNTKKIPSDVYSDMLLSRSMEQLQPSTEFSEAEIVPDSGQLKYGVDYDVGDYITLCFDRYQLRTERIQLVGMIECFDQNGRSLTPEFKTYSSDTTTIGSSTGGSGGGSGTGKDGISPVVTLERKSNGVMIKVKDAEGEKEAFVQDGEDGEPADLTQILAAIENLQESEHIHDNKSVLDGITQAKIDKWDAANTVEITRHITTGTKIATFTVSGTPYDVYAPSSPTAAQIQQWTEAAEKAHTHSNQSTLDKITSSDWTRVTSSAHTHNNLDALNSITPGDVQNFHRHQNLSVLNDITAPYTEEEKEKLARLENYMHPTTSGNKHIPQGGSSGQILRWSADGTAVWGADNDTTYTAGAGLSLSGTKFNHSNSVTAKTTAGFLKVKHDAQGHITGTSAVTKSDITALGIPGENTDTKNTAGATQRPSSSNKLYLVVSPKQAENSQTYTSNLVYMENDDIVLDAGIYKVILGTDGHFYYTSDDSGWERSTKYLTSDGTQLGAIGAYGAVGELIYFFIGKDHQNTSVEIDLDGNIKAKGKVTAQSFSGANATQSAQGLMSAADKKKLDGIAEGANKTIVDAALSSTSTNPVQNKAVKAALDGKAASSHGTHVTYATAVPKAAGTASAGSAANVSRGDHVHPAQTSVSGNAGTATKLQTARTIALSQGLQGSVSFDGSANVTLNGSLKQCHQVDETADFSSYPWHKIADVTLTAAYTDASITFLVSKMWGTVPNNAGILTAHIRSSSTKIFESGQLRWLVAGSDINPSDFFLVYTNTANTSVKAELWYKQNTRYDGWSFTVLKEHSRTSYVNSWKLYSSAGHGSASRTSGTGEIVSSMVPLSNSVTSAAKLTTARTITIGSKGKTFDGSANVSFTLAEIGAAAASHGTHITTTEGRSKTIDGVTRQGSTNCYVFGALSNNFAGYQYSIAEGDGTSAMGSCSHAEGWNSVASGNQSHAFGSNCTASGLNSIAAGSGSKATASETFAFGTNCEVTVQHSMAQGYGCKAKSENSFAGGDCCETQGKNTFAYGDHVITSYTASAVFGRYNNYSYANPQIVLGNGTSSARASAFRATTDGVYSVGSYRSSGADYAEFFEWVDGNPDGEDRRGLFVKLDGEKILIAESAEDDILGIVSGCPSVIGDSYEDQWQGQYETDLYGNLLEEAYIDEDGDIAFRWVLSEEYDPKETYIPRSQRKEWNAVGMMGKLVVVDDGTCVPNAYCVPTTGGIATRSDGCIGYRVLSRVDDTHVKILVK